MNWNFDYLPKSITNEHSSIDPQVIENIKKIVPEDATWIVQEKIQGVSVAVSYSSEDGFHFCVRPEGYENLSYTFHLAEEAAFKIKEKIKCTTCKKHWYIAAIVALLLWCWIF